MKKFTILTALIFSFSLVLFFSGFMHRHNHNRFAAVINDIKYLNRAIEDYKIDNDRIPSENEGLEVLALDCKYIKKIPKDSWDNEYVYSISSSAKGGYSIYSIGVNGIDENGEGDDVSYDKNSYRCERYDTCLGIDDYLYRAFFGVSIMSGLGVFVSVLWAGSLLIRKIIHRL